MAKVTGPLMSLDASGSVADTITFSKWKGRNYVRQTVTPANPKSAGQTSNRSMFGFLAAIWKTLTGLSQGTWDAAGAALNASAFNGFTRFNQNRWTQGLTPWRESTISGTHLPAANTDLSSATGGVRLITILAAFTITPNDNWGLILHRDVNSGFTPSKANAVKIVPWDAVADLSIEDTNLEPGTYYYRATAFDDEGNTFSLPTERSAAAT